MNYWLMKSEPSVYSWTNLEQDKKATWDGVRNFQARNNLKAMKKDDLAFLYHSNEDKAIIGIVKIVKENYPDPKDKNWIVVDIAPVEKLKSSISLAQIKADKRLGEMVLVRSSRLSVQPVRKEEFDMIIKMSTGK